MTKVMYTYRSDTHDFIFQNVADDYVLKTNETFVAPKDGIKLPVTFDGTRWIEATDEQRQAAFDAANVDSYNPGPTTEQQMINALGLQMASLQATVSGITTTGGAK